MDATFKPIELLAPARDADIAIEAIKHGADAVYIGASSHGARAAACNSIADVGRAVDYAHKFNARVYATVNTLIYDNELKTVEQLVKDLYRIGVDALIVQDMALLRLDIPPISLHASTQCDIRDADKANFLQEVGFSRLVLPRELSFDEIAVIRKNVDISLEAFVHGALCVSYSGDCQASCILMGRSANRGECAQMCRLPYDLVDSHGDKLIKEKYLLSLRDLNRSRDIVAMLDAGVTSFKIEGRLKDLCYVKNTVAVYRRIIDEVIANSGGQYGRSSVGEVQLSFTPSLSKGFNRGFTRYFSDGQVQETSMASIDTPKSVGEKVGNVMRMSSAHIIANLSTELHNGDGLGYFDNQKRFCGFRLNKIEKNILFPASHVDLKAGTVLYRNKDKFWDDLLSRNTAGRRVMVDFTIRQAGSLVAVGVSDQRMNRVTATVMCEMQKANTPQVSYRKRVLEKLGNTIYCVNTITDLLGDNFVPASVLAELRRKALSLLDKAQRATYQYRYRRAENHSAIYPAGNSLTYHDNVSNHLAEDFYREHGVSSIEKAAELAIKQRQTTDGMTIMTTRYCIRRELHHCLKTAEGSSWDGPLFLATGNIKLRLDFDCQRCQMKVSTCVIDK